MLVFHLGGHRIRYVPEKGRFGGMVEEIAYRESLAMRQT